MSDMRKVHTYQSPDGETHFVHVLYGSAFGAGNTIEEAAKAALDDIDDMTLKVFQERLMILEFLNQRKKAAEVSA